MTTNDTTTKTDAKPKQATPCERATAALARAGAALKQARSLVGKTPDAQTAALLAETEANHVATKLAAGTACDEQVPYARRLTASGRAKQAADAAEGASGEIKATQVAAAAKADDDRLAEIELTPGYTKNPEWLAIQERIEARRF